MPTSTYYSSTTSTTYTYPAPARPRKTSRKTSRKTYHNTIRATFDPEELLYNLTISAIYQLFIGCCAYGPWTGPDSNPFIMVLMEIASLIFSLVHVAMMAASLDNARLGWADIGRETATAVIAGLGAITTLGLLVSPPKSLSAGLFWMTAGMWAGALFEIKTGTFAGFVKSLGESAKNSQRAVEREKVAKAAAAIAADTTANTEPTTAPVAEHTMAPNTAATSRRARHISSPSVASSSSSGTVMNTPASSVAQEDHNAGFGDNGGFEDALTEPTRRSSRADPNTRFGDASAGGASRRRGSAARYAPMVDVMGWFPPRNPNLMEELGFPEFNQELGFDM